MDGQNSTFFFCFSCRVRQEAAAAASNGNKKRRRDQTTATASTGDEEAVSSANVKQIVRIRAKVHCAAAGLPGLDAPARTEGEDGGGDDPGQLPDWHPLHKVKTRMSLSLDFVFTVVLVSWNECALNRF